MPKLDEQLPVPQPRQAGRSEPAHQALTSQPVRQGFCASVFATCPLWIPGIVHVVGVLRLEPNAPGRGYCHVRSPSGALGRHAPAPQRDQQAPAP
jgi:hypothetical protein